MKITILTFFRIALLLLILNISQGVNAQFVHPGGVHTLADLDRMKAKVNAGAHPWIDGWNLMIADFKAQKNYVARPTSNIGGNNIRQQAQRDATAAYYNMLRWYITGDTTYAECAVRILNAWSGSINQVASGELFQLPIMVMVQAGELLRIYPGWAQTDFTRFKNMCLTYFYPACHSFLGECGSWPSWDGPANICILYIGILCDDQAKFDEAVNYYKNGGGGGALTNMAWQTNGQVTEMGRDQPHAEIGPTCAAEMCQSAWNQGVDLFSYADNRLLAAFEYLCKFNLNHPVDWTPYNDCNNNNFFYPAYRLENRISQAPAYELVYNHYVVKKGLSAPYTRAMINLKGLSTISGEYVGSTALTYTLSDTTTIFQPRPVPAAPAGLTVMPGVSAVILKWNASGIDDANGYNILRSTTAGGPYTYISKSGGNNTTGTYNTSTQYIDTTVINGITYYYRVSANNQSGTSANSAEASATPVNAVTLPVGWAKKDIGNVATAANAGYADVNDKTFILRGSGNVFGTANNDSYSYLYTRVTGDFTITTRLFDVRFSSSNSDRAGLIMRESLDANAAMASIGNHDDGFRRVWFASHATGINATWISGDTHTGIPVWYKLQRVGNTFTGFQSIDGVTWFNVGSTTISIPATYYVGMFVHGGSTTPGVITTATFDHVSTVGGGTSVPAAPTGLTASAANSQVALSWTAVGNAACYNIKRSTTTGGPYSTVAAGITTANYTDTGLVNGTTYYYVVAAANFAGEGANSSQVTATPLLSTPPVPTALSAASVSVTQINLSWSASLSAASYNLKRSTVSGGPYITIRNQSGNSYIDTTVITDTTYYYVVSAVNAAGESANSAPVKATPGRISYWKFDETNGTTAADTWSGKAGTLLSGATLTGGAINNGVKLNGTANGYVTLPAGIVSDINDFTISAWVKIDVPGVWSRIFDFGSNTSNYMFLARSNTGGLRYAIKSGGSGEQGMNSNKTIVTGAWTHVAVTWTGNTGVMYMDGVEVGRNTNMNFRPSSLGPTTQNWFGRSQYSSDPYFNGVLDEIQLYNRALSASEVYNLSLLPVPPAAPLSLTITEGNNQLTLNWNAPASATSYNIKRATTANGPFSVIANVTGSTYVDTTAYNCNDFYYVVSAVNAKGEGANSALAGLSLGKKLTAKLIGTDGSWNNNAATTKAAAVDGNLGTYFDAATGTAWLGYDFGADTSVIINKVRYAPRGGNEGRMIGGMFQGSNVADFSSATTLFTITVKPSNGVLTEQAISNTVPFRYVRYISPSNGFGNASEIEFYGVSVVAPKMVNKAGIKYLPYDSSFNYDIMAANRPKQYGASGLPDGLTLNTCTGVIDGKPNVAGSFSVVLTASNSLGTATDTMVLKIQKDQAIKFDSIADKSTRDVDFNLPASASSGLPVSYTSSDTTVATVGADGKVHIVGGGFTNITASQSGNDQYKPASPVTHALQVFVPPYVRAKNMQLAVDNNGLALIIPNLVDSGSVSYNGTLTLRLNVSSFDCSNVGTPVTVTLTGTDAKGYSDSATATVTVIDTLKPVINCTGSQFFCYNNTGSYTIPALQAADNCGIAMVVYVITGATTRTGQDSNASGIFNVGQSVITYTVTDVHGNQSSCSVMVTVNTPITAVIPDVYAMNPAVDKKNTIYLGYGSGSLIIADSVTGGTQPFTYSWNTGQTTKSVRVSNSGNYTVIVTDAKGCVATASTSIAVLDVRCGNNNDKVMVCHNNHAICVASAAVQEHLNHGDVLGTCPDTGSRIASVSADQGVAFRSVGIYPNPSNGSFITELERFKPGKAVITMTDGMGRMVKRIPVVISANKQKVSINTGHITQGLYFIQIVSDEGVEVRTLVIQR